MQSKKYIYNMSVSYKRDGRAALPNITTAEPRDPLSYDMFCRLRDLYMQNSALLRLHHLSAFLRTFVSIPRTSFGVKSGVCLLDRGEMHPPADCLDAYKAPLHGPQNMYNPTLSPHSWISSNFKNTVFFLRLVLCSSNGLFYYSLDNNPCRATIFPADRLI